ncbi:MAG: hypothetical protein FWE57_04760 [Chitinispirillia bacterium]|nr:hypothetical protein [Chitinispirillia bacterium]
MRFNGTYIAVTDNAGGNWSRVGSGGTWSVSGNSLVLTGSGVYTGNRNYTLSTDGNTLTWGSTAFSRVKDASVSGLSKSAVVEPLKTAKTR